MNAKDKAKVLQDNGYRYEKTKGGHRWTFPDGDSCGTISFAVGTGVAYRHYLANPPQPQQAPAPYFENPEMLDDYSGHDYAADAQAPAPVDELEAALQASRENATELETCVGELKAEVAELRLERLELQRQVETLKMDDKISDNAITDLAAENKLLKENVLKWLDNFETIEAARAALEKHPHAAPVQADVVTLTKEEIEWLANNQVSDGDFYCFANSNMPTTLNAKLREDNPVNDALYWVFRFRKDYDTPANRAAIAARRAELDKQT